MTTTDPLRVDTVEGLLVILIDRPAKANALNGRMLQDMQQILTTHADDHVAAVIRGAGRWFTGGVDLVEALPSSRSPDSPPPVPPSTHLQGLVDVIRNLPQPVVALVDGACIGGGVELVSACDLRIGTPASTFRVPATEIGVVYRPEGVTTLRRALSPGAARHLLLTGLSWNADQALVHGLLDMVVEDEQAWDHTVELCHRLTSVPRTFCRQKRSLRLLDDSVKPDPEVLAAVATIRAEHTEERSAQRAANRAHASGAEQ